MQSFSEPRGPKKEPLLQRLYTGGEYSHCTEEVLACPAVERVYGPLRFPPLPAERSYCYGSFVASIDGKIAFPQAPNGTLVARSNRLDPEGGRYDYWILNLLRAASDAVILGRVTLSQESNMTGEVKDPELLECRIAAGQLAVPFHIIPSSSGEKLPLNHRVYREKHIPTLTVLPPGKARKLAERLSGHFTLLPSVSQDKELHLLPQNLENRGTNYLLGLGEGETVDPLLLLKALKRFGFHRTLVETPSFLASLLDSQALDELFLNTSGIFIGGPGITLGQHHRSFTPEEHPHTKVVTLHSHSDSFFYTRYRFQYLPS